MTNAYGDGKLKKLFFRNRATKLKAAGGRCSLCKKPAKVVHHLNKNKRDHRINNLVVVCYRCHSAFHPVSKNRERFGMTGKEIAERLRITHQAVYDLLKKPHGEKSIKIRLKEADLGRETRWKHYAEIAA